MKIFDTLSHKYHELNEDSAIKFYVCGPTVYNHVHLGNIRPPIVFDVMVRFLQWNKKRVEYVHNITDIDDKIINQAKLENTSEMNIATQYTNSYFEVLSKLNILPMQNPKVSENINGIINYIEQLIASKAAYVIDGSVYFNVDKISTYGELSKIKIDELLLGERIEINSDKKNPLDFVLWKKTTYGLNWDSPWGKGRPGWHTECAYLINQNFGKQVTIHGGGIDLRFPHHENELAQHKALFNVPLSKYWMHVGHLNVDNEKMSKSLNNFIYAKQLLDSYDYQVIRWLFYQNHYQSPINFDSQFLSNAVKDINRIFLTLNKARTILVINGKSISTKYKVNNEFYEAINDDLNFANATKSIWGIINEINNCHIQKKYQQLSELCEELQWCLSIYGIEPANIHNKINIDLIKQWNAKVQNKEYKAADELRAKIISKKLL